MADHSAESRALVYAAIERAMTKFPDLRIGQLFENAESGAVANLFYIENAELAKAIDQYVEDNRARSRP